MMKWRTTSSSSSSYLATSTSKTKGMSQKEKRPSSSDIILKDTKSSQKSKMMTIRKKGKKVDPIQISKTGDLTDLLQKVTAAILISLLTIKKDERLTPKTGTPQHCGPCREGYSSQTPSHDSQITETDLDSQLHPLDIGVSVTE